MTSGNLWTSVLYVRKLELPRGSFHPPLVKVPPFPWHTLGTDLFYWKHQDFIVVAGYFSKFLIFRRLPSSTAQDVIQELSMIFIEYGQPVIISGDNGPCYASKEFYELMELFHIDHISNSPFYSQSNGFAESMVKLSKKLMEHSALWNYGLFEFRCTPISGTFPSPLEILRVPHSVLPQLPATVTANTPQIQ